MLNVFCIFNVPVFQFFKIFNKGSSGFFFWMESVKKFNFKTFADGKLWEVFHNRVIIIIRLYNDPQCNAHFDLHPFEESLLGGEA